MKIREAYKTYGGKKALDKMCNAVAKKYGISVVATGVVDEEDPKSNFLTIQFEYSGSDEGRKKFLLALDTVNRRLMRKGLELQHECNGDGSIGIIRSYRVI